MCVMQLAADGRAPGEPPKGLPKMEPKKGAVGSWDRRRPVRARRGAEELWRGERVESEGLVWRAVACSFCLSSFSSTHPAEARPTRTVSTRASRRGWRAMEGFGRWCERLRAVRRKRGGMQASAGLSCPSSSERARCAKGRREFPRPVSRCTRASTEGGRRRVRRCGRRGAVCAGRLVRGKRKRE